MANVRTSIAALVAAAAISGGIYEGTVSSPPPDKVGTNEIVALRTIDSKTFDKNNGEYVTFIGSAPMNWDDNGTLKSYDTAVRRRPVLTALFSKYEFESYIGNAKALFDSSNVADYAFSSGDYSVDYQFLTKGDVEVNTEVNTTGVKQTYIINDEKIKELRWLVTGCDKHLNPDGSLQLADGSFGTKAPVSWDKNGVPIELTVSLSGDTLSYSVTDGIYPVTIDPTTAVYPGGGSPTIGMFQYDSVGSPNYSVPRNATSYSSNDAASGYFGQGYDGPHYYMYRTHVYINTADLPDDIIISAATVCLGELKTDGDTTVFNFYLVTATTSGATADSLWFNDFTGWLTSGAYTGIEYLSAAIASNGFALGDTIKVAMNATGLTKISKTGITRFMVLSAEDISASAPTADEFLTAGIANTYIAVTYTLAGFAGKVDAVSSITKVDGIANVVKVDGIQ